MVFDQIMNELTDGRRFGDTTRLFDMIFREKAFAEWLFIGDRDKRKSSYTMDEFLDELTNPMIINDLVKYIKATKLNKTGAVILNIIVQMALVSIAQSEAELEMEQQSGNSTKTDKLTRRIELYTEDVNDLIKSLQYGFANAIEEEAADIRIAPALYEKIFYDVPDTRFVPKYKIEMFVQSIHREIMEYYAGQPDTKHLDKIRWNTMFDYLFNDVTAAAIAILVTDFRKDMENEDLSQSNNVKDVYDYLTVWAIEWVDGLNDKDRDYAMQIYIKKAHKMSKDNRGYKPRVDLIGLDLSSYTKVASSIDKYLEYFEAMSNGIYKEFQGVSNRNSDRDKYSNDRRDTRPDNRRDDRRPDNRDTRRMDNNRGSDKRNQPDNEKMERVNGYSWDYKLSPWADVPPSDHARYVDDINNVSHISDRTGKKLPIEDDEYEYGGSKVFITGDKKEVYRKDNPGNRASKRYADDYDGRDDYRAEHNFYDYDLNEEDDDGFTPAKKLKDYIF